MTPTKREVHSLMHIKMSHSVERAHQNSPGKRAMVKTPDVVIILCCYQTDTRDCPIAAAANHDVLLFARLLMTILVEASKCPSVPSLLQQVPAHTSLSTPKSQNRSLTLARQRLQVPFSYPEQSWKRWESSPSNQDHGLQAFEVCLIAALNRDQVVSHQL